ncbi:hypothetical protein VTH06DRAFT_7646 [Thermothelomyces fergusii]
MIRWLYSPAAPGPCGVFIPSPKLLQGEHFLGYMTQSLTVPQQAIAAYHPHGSDLICIRIPMQKKKARHPPSSRQLQPWRLRQGKENDK